MESLKRKNLYNLKKCPVCASNSKIIDIVRTINVNSDEKLNLRECLQCGHWWFDPMSTQDYLNSLYESGSEFVVSENYQGREMPEEFELTRYVSQFLDKIKNINQLNYLEIGVGPGYLFEFFKKKVKNCYGVDPCRWKPEDPHIFNDIKDIPISLRFDIIVIQDVLEHLENPIDMLKKVKEFANKNCIISCGFPNKDSLIAKIFKSRWSMIRPIGHLHYFSSKSVDSIFKQSGWKIIKKYSFWPVPSPIYYFKNFDYKSKNILKLIYRIIRDLLLKQLLMGKDQWRVIAKACDD